MRERVRFRLLLQRVVAEISDRRSENRKTAVAADDRRLCCGGSKRLTQRSKQNSSADFASKLLLRCEISAMGARG